MTPRQAASARSTAPTATTDDPTRAEDLHVRNHDPYNAYDLEVAITDASGDTAFEQRYYLQPGHLESVRGALGPGVYDVTVELDNHRSKTARCRVGPAPEHTIHVEVGNGIVSLTEGLYR